jgi:hypothetical protein
VLFGNTQPRIAQTPKLTTPIAEQAEQTAMSNDLIHVLVSLEESVTHHLNELSAIQLEVDYNFLSNEFINVLTQYCDDLFSSGDDVNLNVLVRSH